MKYFRFVSFEELEDILDENSFENACFRTRRCMEEWVAVSEEQGWKQVISDTTDLGEYGMHLGWEETFFSVLSEARQEESSVAEVYRRVQEYLWNHLEMAEHEVETASLTGTSWSLKSRLLEAGAMVHEIGRMADDYEEMVVSLYKDAEAAVQQLPEDKREEAFDMLAEKRLRLRGIRQGKLSLSEVLSMLRETIDADELQLLVRLCTDEDYLAEHQGRLRDVYQLFYKLHRFFDPGKLYDGQHNDTGALTSGYEVLIRFEPSEISTYSRVPQNDISVQWYEAVMDDPRSQIREACPLSFQKEKRALLRELKKEYGADFSVVED